MRNVPISSSVSNCSARIRVSLPKFQLYVDEGDLRTALSLQWAGEMKEHLRHFDEARGQIFLVVDHRERKEGVQFLANKRQQAGKRKKKTNKRTVELVHYQFSHWLSPTTNPLADARLIYAFARAD